MEDNEIVELFWQRDPQALAAAADKYTAYCRTVADHILQSPEDTEECLNDAWLRAWNAMPPQRPRNLKLFLARIARNLALDRYSARKAEKRGGGEMELVLDELAECLPDRTDVEREYEGRELEQFVRSFVRGLPAREGNVFVRRYFYAESAAEIGKRYGLTGNHVMVILSRTRAKLQKQLKKEGYL